MIRVRFCGTRGTLTTPGKATLRYGGNTPCIQVVGFDGMEPGAAARWDNPQLILDGGTGILSLVRELTYFYENYKRAEGKTTKVEKWDDLDEAKSIIEWSRGEYRKQEEL